MPLPEAPATGKLPFEPPENSSPDLAPFWKLWRAEKFWACHEALEEVWRAEEEAERRRFLQGLVHCAVAVFQHRRGNAKGAARQWTRANARLEPFGASHENLDLEALLHGVENEIRASLEQDHEGMEQLVQELEVKLSDIEKNPGL